MDSLPIEIQQDIVVRVGAQCLADSQSSFRDKRSFQPWNRQAQLLYRKDHIFAQIVINAYQHVLAKNQKRLDGEFWIRFWYRSFVNRLPSSRLTIPCLTKIFTREFPEEFLEELSTRFLKDSLSVQYEHTLRRLLRHSNHKRNLLILAYTGISEHGNFEAYTIWSNIVKEYGIPDQAVIAGLRPLVELCYLHHNLGLARSMLPEDLGVHDFEALLTMMVVTDDVQTIEKFGNKFNMDLETLLPRCVDHLYQLSTENQRRLGFTDLWGSSELIKSMGQGALTLRNQQYESVRDFAAVYHFLKDMGYQWDEDVVVARAISSIGGVNDEDVKLLGCFPIHRVWSAVCTANETYGLSYYEAANFLITKGLFSIAEIPFSKLHKAHVIRDMDEMVLSDMTHWIWNIL